ncbi:unnamed protein product [Calypogeia fissa]
MRVRQQRPIMGTIRGPWLMGPKINPAGPRLPGNQVRRPPRAPDQSTKGGRGVAPSLRKSSGTWHIIHEKTSMAGSISQHVVETHTARGVNGEQRGGDGGGVLHEGRRARCKMELEVAYSGGGVESGAAGAP